MRANWAGVGLESTGCAEFLPHLQVVAIALDVTDAPAMGRRRIWPI